MSFPINCKLLEDKAYASLISVYSVSHTVLSTFYLNKCLLNDWMTEWADKGCSQNTHPCSERQVHCWEFLACCCILSTLTCSGVFFLFRNYTTYSYWLWISYLWHQNICFSSDFAKDKKALINPSNILLSVMCKDGHYIRRTDKSDIIQSSREI